MANHASTRTTQIYGRRAEEVTLDEAERILVRSQISAQWCGFLLCYRPRCMANGDDSYLTWVKRAILTIFANVKIIAALKIASPAVEAAHRKTGDISGGKDAAFVAKLSIETCVSVNKKARLGFHRSRATTCEVFAIKSIKSSKSSRNKARGCD